MTQKDFRFGISSDANGLDLNQLLITHPSSTFFMRLADDIPELDLVKNDIVQVDRSLSPRVNDVVVATTIGDPELKLIRFQEKQSGQDVWGVAESVIRSMRP